MKQVSRPLADVRFDAAVRAYHAMFHNDLERGPLYHAAQVTDIRRIATAMLERGVAGVPIVSAAGRLVGFVSRSDILRAVVTDPPLSLWR